MQSFYTISPKDVRFVELVEVLTRARGCFGCDCRTETISIDATGQVEYLFQLVEVTQYDVQKSILTTIKLDIRKLKSTEMLLFYWPLRSQSHQMFVAVVLLVPPRILKARAACDPRHGLVQNFERRNDQHPEDAADRVGLAIDHRQRPCC